MSPKLLNLLLVLLPPVLYFGYINPAYTGEAGLVWTPETSILALKSQNVQYENTLNQVSLVEDGANKLAKDYAAVDEETRQKLAILLPDSIEQIKLRNEILNIAAKSGVAVQGLTVEKDLKGDKNLNFYTVQFGLKSRYPAFKRFMESYERNMRFFILEGATIKRQEKDDTDPNAAPIDDDEALLINVSSRVYFMK